MTDTLIHNIDIFLIVIMSALTLSGLIHFFRHQNAVQSDAGINLKRVYCPTCKARMPIIRIPKNERQKYHGGWTCKHCNTEMDKWGNEIK